MKKIFLFLFLILITITLVLAFGGSESFDSMYGGAEGYAKPGDADVGTLYGGESESILRPLIIYNETSPINPTYNQAVNITFNVTEASNYSISGNVTFYSPNGTETTINAVCNNDDQAGSYSCNTSSAHTLNEYERWNYTIYVRNSIDRSDSLTNKILIHNIYSFETSPPTRSLAENITLWANTTEEMDSIKFIIHNRTDETHEILNVTNFTEQSTGIWNSTVYSSRLYIGEYTAKMTATSTHANYTGTSQFNFTVTGDLHIEPSEIIAVPDPGNETQYVNLTMYTDSYSELDYTVACGMSTSEGGDFNTTITNSSMTLGLNNYNETSRFYNLLTIDIGNTANDTYYGSCNYTRTFDSAEFITNITLGINPPSGEIQMQLTDGTICTGDICDWSISATDNDVLTQGWIVYNSGNYTLSACTANFTGESLIASDLKDYPSYYNLSFTNTSIGIGENVNVTATLTNLPVDTYYGQLVVTCNATSFGYQDSSDTRPDNVPEARYITITAATIYTQSGGGAPRVPSIKKEEIIEKVLENISEMVKKTWCGDGICGEGETPHSCWTDCKINFDTLVKCIWDPEIDCSWKQAWFPTLLVMIVIGTIITVFIFAEFRGGPDE